MNVNVKLSISDENRNVMFKRLTGKNGKGMVSRADVNNWVKEQLEKFLTHGSPDYVRSIPQGVIKHEDVDETPDIDLDDFTQDEVIEIMKQNRLLQTRVNTLQHRLDTGR